MQDQTHFVLDRRSVYTIQVHLFHVIFLFSAFISLSLFLSGCFKVSSTIFQFRFQISFIESSLPPVFVYVVKYPRLIHSIKFALSSAIPLHVPVYHRRYLHACATPRPCAVIFDDSAIYFVSDAKKLSYMLGSFFSCRYMHQPSLTRSLEYNFYVPVEV